jgi:Lipase maturation factor
LPARLQVENVGTAKVSAIHKKPTLLHLSTFLGIDTASALDLFALMGILIAFSGFISQKFCVLPTFAALWSLYFSLIQIVQQFGNQADDLLLEAGLICIILAPFTSPKTRSPVDSVGLLLLRWLTFRFMFTSGAVKLASGCATWWSLGGFLHHFETMPLPTPLSWYSHHLPESILKLTQVYVHVSELVVPWLFFMPNGTVRKFAFYWLIFLQLNIIPTGNYGLLNFLLITLLFSLLDDTHFYGKRQNQNKNVMGMVWTLAIIAGISFGTYKLFGLEFKNGEILTKIAFTKTQYMDTLEKMVKISPLVALISILYGFLNTIITHDAIRKPTNLITKTISVGKLLLFTIIALGLVGVSTVPHGKLHANTNISMSTVRMDF